MSEPEALLSPEEIETLAHAEVRTVGTPWAFDHDVAMRLVDRGLLQQWRTNALNRQAGMVYSLTAHGADALAAARKGSA